MKTAQLCDKYLAEYAPRKKSAGNDAWLVAKYVRPELGDMLVINVKYAHVDRLHQKLKKTPFAANRCLSLLSIMFKLAERWELRERGTNPCIGIERFKEPKRKRYTSEDEARAVLTALNARWDKYPLEVALILLELYTGARPGELKNIEWSWIHGTRVELPDSKTGEGTIFLNPQALAVVSRLPQARRWVIGPDVNARYVWASVLDDTGIKDLRMYDLRHSYASFGLQAKQSLGEIGSILRHTTPATTHRYVHLSPAHGQRVTDEIGAHMKTIGL